MSNLIERLQDYADHCIHTGQEQVHELVAEAIDLIERLAGLAYQPNGATYKTLAIAAQGQIRERVAEIDEKDKRIEELERNATTLPEYVGALRLLQRQLDELLEAAESALGCTDGDDIREHLYPEIQRIREMNDDLD